MLRFFDFEQLENNVFHVTEEFEVERMGSPEHRIPDLVLFVNGIPLGVIECKSPLLHSICRPERLMELFRKFMVFDAGKKKAPRYQQYFRIG